MGKNRNGDLLKIYLSEIGKYETLTHKETIELLKKYKNGDEEAKQKLYYHNLKLVYYFVSRLAPAFISETYDIMDLIQEGNIALMKAIENFDLNKTDYFSTYVFSTVKNSIIRNYISSGTRKQISENTFMNEVKMRKIELEFEIENGREPTNEELSKIMKLPLSSIDFLKLAQKRSISLDDKITYLDNEDITFMDLLKDETTDAEYENVLNKMESEWVYPLVINADFLSDKEKKVFKMYFGFDLDKPMNLREISNELGCSREWARKIKDRVIKKIIINIDFDKKKVRSKKSIKKLKYEKNLQSLLPN